MELHHVAAREGRLSVILRQDMKMSSGLVNRVKWQGELLVNGVSVHTDHPVAPGDRILCRVAEPEQNYPAEDGPLRVLYEDEAILAVDKPAGMLIHPSRSRISGTLANFVQGYYQKTGGQGAFHPITRLDRDTFGVVLIAKNSHIHALLGELHRRGALNKTYEALVFGHMPAAEGRIDGPIARLPLPSMLRQVSPEGKPSLTEYRVLEEAKGFSRVLLMPVTGRTHQLRVHCAYVGCPILGDPQYGSEASRIFSEERGLFSQVLCARSLEFPHPLTGQSMTIRSKMPLLPEAQQQWEEKCEKPTF